MSHIPECQQGVMTLKQHHEGKLRKTDACLCDHQLTPEARNSTLRNHSHSAMTPKSLTWLSAPLACGHVLHSSAAAGLPV
eukprot:4579074-Amphidinium_carterae.1